MTVEFLPLLELDYMKKIADLRKAHGGKFHSMTNGNHCVYVTHAHKVECIGNLSDLNVYATETHGIADPETANTASFESLARVTTSNLLVGTGHTIVYLDFIDGSKIRTARSPEYGKIVIEL